MKKLTNLLVAGTLSMAMITPALAEDAQPLIQNNLEDAGLIFETDVQPMQLAVLSEREMKETEGAVLWFAPIAFQLGRYAAVRIAHHSAHHTFRYGGRLPHLQMNYWRPGVSGSGGAIRIPLPNRPFFRP